MEAPLKSSLYILWPFTSRYGLLICIALYFIFLFLLLYFLLFVVFCQKKKNLTFKIEKNQATINITNPLFFSIFLSFLLLLLLHTVWCPSNCALVTYPHMYINEFNRFFYLFFTTRFFFLHMSSFVCPFSTSFVCLYFDFIFIFFSIFFYILFCVATGVQ